MYHVYADGASIYDPLNNSYFLFSPKVKLEFGKAGSCEFVIPPGNINYNELKQMKTIITVEEDDGTEIFRGRVLNISRDFNNLKTIYCEGDLAYLVDSVQKAVKYEGTVHELFRKIIRKHNAMVEEEKKFRVGNITIDDRPIKIAGKSEEIDNTGKIDYKQIAIDSIADNWNSTYDYIQSCIIDYCGGYLQTRRQNDHTYLDLWKKHDNVRDAKVTFGVNMLDFTEEANVENDEFCTVLIPLGDENLTIASVNNNSEELVDEALVEEYGRIVRTHVFQNVNNASTLLADAKRYMKFNEEPPITITVRAIDMHFIDQTEATIHIGDYVKIVSNPHGVSRRLVCTEIEYDLEDPSNTSYTFGNPKQTLTRRYKEDKRKTSEASSASSAAGAGGAGSGAVNWVLKETDESVDDKIQKAHDAWFNLDPNTGTGELAGIYREFLGVKNVLERQVGIDFDAEEGNINLTALQRELNEQGEMVDTKIAGVSTTVNDRVNEAKLFAENLVTGSKAEIKTYIDSQDQSIISAKADKVDIEALRTSISGTSETVTSIKNTLKHQVGIDVDAQTGNVNISSLAQLVDQQGKTISKTSADLTTMSNSLQSKISQVAEYADSNGKKIASIETTASRLGTQIALKADKTTVDSKVTEINSAIVRINGEVENLKARKITATELETLIANISTLRVNSLNVAGTLVAADMYSNGSPSAGHRVTTWDDVAARLNNITAANSPGNAHYHVLTENSDGTISLGYATSEPQSFNISATKAYRDAVAAAEAAGVVTSIVKRDHPVYGPEYFNTTTHRVTVYVRANRSNGTPYDGAVETSDYAYNQGYTEGASVGAGQGYTEGWNAVTISRVGRDTTRSTTFPYVSNVHYAHIPVIATASNGKSGTGDDYVDVSIEDIYQDGVFYGEQNVSIRASDIIRYRDDTYNTSTHKYTIYIRATAFPNMATNTKTFETGTEAWDAGRAQGEADAKDQLIVYDPTITNTNWTKVGNYYQTTVTATALTNVAGKSSKATKVIYGTEPYGYGKKDGIDSVTVNTPTLTSVAWEKDSNNSWVYTVYATGSASNGKSSNSASLKVYGTTPFNDGKNGVTLTGAVGNIADGSGNYSSTISKANTTYNNKWTYGRITATLSNNKSYTIRVGMNSEKAFDAGKNSVPADQSSKVSVSKVAQDSYSSSYTTFGISDANAVYTSPHLYGSIKITLSNGKEAYRTVKINAKKAYNAGKKDGAASATPSIDGPYLQKTTYSGERELYYVQPVVYVNGTPYYGSVEYMSDWRKNGMI